MPRPFLFQPNSKGGSMSINRTEDSITINGQEFEDLQYCLLYAQNSCDTYDHILSNEIVVKLMNFNFSDQDFVSFDSDFQRERIHEIQNKYC